MAIKTYNVLGCNYLSQLNQANVYNNTLQKVNFSSVSDMMLLKIPLQQIIADFNNKIITYTINFDIDKHKAPSDAIALSAWSVSSYNENTVTYNNAPIVKELNYKAYYMDEIGTFPKKTDFWVYGISEGVAIGKGTRTDALSLWCDISKYTLNIQTSSDIKLKPTNITANRNPLYLTRERLKISFNVAYDKGIEQCVIGGATQKTLTIEYKYGSSGSVNTISLDTSNQFYEFENGVLRADNQFMYRIKLTSNLGVDGVFSEWNTVSLIEDTFVSEILLPIQGQKLNPLINNVVSWNFKRNDGTIEKQATAVLSWKTKESSQWNVININSENTMHEFKGGILPKKQTILIKVDAVNAYGYKAESSELEFLTHDIPEILSLEPDGIDQNVDNNIKVSWVTNNQSVYKLLLKNSIGSVLKQYVGATEKEILIPSNTLTHGIINISLEITDNTTGISASKTASFVAYGTPPTPQQDLKTTYNTSRPTFTWLLNSEQVAYQLQVLKGTTVLEDSTQLTGTANSYDCKTALENNQTLDVKVRIKNRYNLWSEWSIKTIKIYYAVLPTPSFTLSVDEDKVIVSCFSPVNDNFYSHEVYRSTGDNVWARMALNLSKEDTFTDHTCASDVTYYYKVSAIGVNGGITDSDIKSVKTTCNDFNFIDVENMDTRHTLRKEPKVSSRMIREVTGVKYSGTLAPTREASGEKPYKQFSMAFTFDREDEMMFEKLLMTEILLLKDGRGNKLYGFIDGSIEESNQEAVNLKTVSFTFTQVNFLEADIYDPKHQRKVIYLDGTYMLDGTLLLNGLEGVVK